LDSDRTCITTLTLLNLPTHQIHVHVFALLGGQIKMFTSNPNFDSAQISNWNWDLPNGFDIVGRKHISSGIRFMIVPSPSGHEWPRDQPPRACANWNAHSFVTDGVTASICRVQHTGNFGFHTQAGQGIVAIFIQDSSVF
jgi:hypothetical protein